MSFRPQGCQRGRHSMSCFCFRGSTPDLEHDIFNLKFHLEQLQKESKKTGEEFMEESDAAHVHAFRAVCAKNMLRFLPLRIEEVSCKLFWLHAVPFHGHARQALQRMWQGSRGWCGWCWRRAGNGRMRMRRRRTRTKRRRTRMRTRRTRKRKK